MGLLPLLLLAPGCKSLSGSLEVETTEPVGDSGGDAPTDDSDTGTADTEPQDTRDEDDAVVAAVDLPSALSCGDSWAAVVEVRNTGSATWSRDGGYKLGAVDDQDDFYSADTRVWLPDGVTVAPGETHVFAFELTAPQAEGATVTDWQMVHEGVRWFGQATSQSVVVTCTAQTWCDPLTSDALQSGFVDKDVGGGSFSARGWQVTDGGDQLELELPTTLGGTTTFELDVTNFDPATQYSGSKHQIINMYTSGDGSQAVFDTEEAWWNIRTGTNYGTGLKLLAAPIGGDSREEVRLIEDASWSPSDVHTFRVEWNSTEVQLSLDGSELATLAFDGQVSPMQHVFLGKDNVYGGQVGPIYSNLCVTQEP